jgi:hypothetical protein
MNASRRASLLRDAGGDDAEESAVCYLQILLTDWLPGMGRARMLLDMDHWGYSFRLGSTRAWFENDSEVLAGIQNVIGILIIGFALYEAWRVNAYAPLQIEGPFQIGARPKETPA